MRPSLTVHRPRTIPAIGLVLLLLPIPAAAQLCTDTLFGNGFEYGDVSDWTAVDGAADVPAVPTVFRIDSLALRDPHVFVDVDIFGCVDATDDVPLPGVDSVNDVIDATLNEDGDGDGCLDTTSLLAFRPLVTTDTGTETVDFRRGRCVSTTQCDPGDPGPGDRELYSTLGMGTCLETVPGTTSGYSPAVTTPEAPCFSTFLGDASLDVFGDVPITLRDVQIAAVFNGDPTSTLVDGLLMGFLTESDADAYVLPGTIPVVGGMALSSLFPGGTGNCAAGTDVDLDGKTPGWWLYFQFTATMVAWPQL